MRDEKMRSRVESELGPGEKILWTGRPRSFSVNWIMLPGILFALFFIVLFVSIFFLGTDAETTVESSEQLEEISDDLSLAGAILFLMFAGIFMIVPLVIFLGLLRAFLTPIFEIYALTNQRAIILSNIFPKKVSSFSGQMFDNMSRSGRHDLGTIYFGPRNFLHNLAVDQYGFPGKFYKIENAKKVEALILKTFISKDDGR